MHARKYSALARVRRDDKPGPHVVLIKWHPGYMSAPHTYVTDRLCFYHLRYLVGDHRASACSGSQRRWVTRTGRSHEPSWSGHAISRPLSFPHTNVPCWPLKTRLRAQKSIEQDRSSATSTAQAMALFGLSLVDGRGHFGGEADEFKLAVHPDGAAAPEGAPEQSGGTPR